MSSMTLVSSRSFDFEIVTAMLFIKDTIFIAAKSPHNSWFFPKAFGLFQCNEDPKPHKILGDYKNIPDMAMVKADSFAFIDQGVWASCDIHLVKMIVKQGKCYLHESTIFSTESNCCGICFTEGHYFLTFSGYINEGYVEMLGETGSLLRKYQTIPERLKLFSFNLSKIYVDPDFVMYVSDDGKQQLTVIKLSRASLTARVSAEYENTTANCIIPKGNKKLFIAVGGKRKEVVLHSTHGPRNFIRHNELNGTPTALCLVGEVLYVATMDIGWFSTKTRIQGFKGNKCIKREEHVISM